MSDLIGLVLLAWMLGPLLVVSWLCKTQKES